MFPSATTTKDDIQNTKHSDDTIHQVGRKVRNFYDNTSDNIHHAKETVTSQIRSNPIQSSLMALGAGMALGMLFRRG